MGARCRLESHATPASESHTGAIARTTEEPIEPPLTGLDAVVPLCRRLAGAWSEAEVLAVVAEELGRTLGMPLMTILPFAENPILLATERLVDTGSGGAPLPRMRRQHIDYLVSVGQFVTMALDRIRLRESQRQIDQSLYRANELLQAALESASDVVVIVDATGRIESVNPAGQALSALPSGQLQGAALKDAFHLLDESTLMRVDSLAASGPGTDFPPRQLALHDRFGKMHLVQCGAESIHDSDGNSQGIVMLIRDATRLGGRTEDSHGDRETTMIGKAPARGAIAVPPQARVRRLRQRTDEASSLVPREALAPDADIAEDITARERDCINWCAAGKTAWETGQILGISEWTVVYHLNRTKRRFGLTRKHQLIARAVSLGVVSRP